MDFSGTGRRWRAKLSRGLLKPAALTPAGLGVPRLVLGYNFEERTPSDSNSTAPPDQMIT